MNDTNTTKAPQSREDALRARRTAAEARHAAAKAVALQAANRLRKLQAQEAAERRKAETKGKIILGGLVLADKELVYRLASKASERDLAYLVELGWVDEGVIIANKSAS